MKFQSILASVLVSACSFCALTSQAEAITWEAFLGQLDEGKMTADAEVNVGGTLALSQTINLDTYTLKLNGVTAISGSGTFTGAVGSVLDLDIASNATQTMSIKGDLKLIKRGAGQLTVLESDYKGECEIIAGSIKPNSYGNKYKYYGASPKVTVHAGAIAYLNACYGFTTSHKFILAGGTIEGGRNDTTESHVVQPKIELTANSRFAPSTSLTLGSEIQLGGYTLEVSAGGATTYWKPSLIANGTINVTKGTLTLKTDVGSSTASLELGPKAAMEGNYTYSVKDLVFANDASVAGPIHVYGTYKPASVSAYMPVMQGGSTLDLSGLDAPMELKAANFASGTVVLAFGGRELEQGETVVSWDVKPADVTLAYSGTAIDTSKFAVSDSGVVYDAVEDSIASMTWSDNPVDGDWLNPANWVAKNATGNTITPDRDAITSVANTLVVSVGGDISSLTFNADFPFAGVNFVNAELSDTLDLTSFDLGLISADSIIDLKGNTIKLLGADGECPCSATITSSVQGGKVEWTVSEGEAYTNDTLTLTGDLDLVKLGAGTFIAKKCPQEFNGATIVREGTLKPGMNNVNATDGKSPFGGLLTIDLEEGGTLDPAGSYAWGNHTINLKGGKISNTVERRGRGTAYNSNATEQFNPCLKLYANTLFETTEMFNFEGRVLVQDKTVADTLTIQVPAGKTFLWAPTSSNGYATENLHLKVVGGELEIWRRLPVAAAKNPGFTLEIENATLNMDYYQSSANLFEGGMAVVDYISSCTADMKNKNVAVLSVSGTFTPNTDYFYGATMLAGSSINLAGKTEAWSVASKDTGVTHVLKFAGGKVTLKLGGRTINPGDQILAWTTRPVGVEFAFEGDNVMADTPVVLGDEGLFCGYAEEPQIVWTNATGDNDLTNPNNWDPVGVPTDVKATFTGDISNLSVPEGRSFDATKIWFNNAEISKDVDFSWLNLANVANESILDIKGHTITLKGVDGECTSAGVITSSAEGGLVKFEVSAGVTYTNANFIFDGQLAFEKIGEGVLVAAKYPQTYTGKTTVSGGVLRCAEGQNLNAQNGLSPFGASCTVAIEKDAFLDPAGSYLWGYHTIEMNGGTISNTVREIGANSTAYNAGSFPKPFNPALNLSDESLLVSTKDFNFNGVICPNGHKLIVKTAAELRWAPTKVNAAEVEFTGKGHLVTLKNTTPKMSDITLVMNDFTFDVGCWMVVSNYTAMAGNTDPVSSQSCWHEGGMTVSGTFTPTASKFFGCQMLDGSTIDLSGKKASWSTTTASSYKNGPLTVTFANNAKVTIDVHGREFADGEQIVTWTTEPTNLEGLTFELDTASKEAGYKLKKETTGLFAWVDTGSEMTVEEIEAALPNGVMVNGEKVSIADKSAAEIKGILNAKADNGLSVNENVLLGIDQEEDGRFVKKPYLVKDEAAISGDEITFNFGGIAPMYGKANIQYEIEEASSLSAGTWSSADSGALESAATTATATLPVPDENSSGVKYYRVKFTVQQK